MAVRVRPRPRIAVETRTLALALGDLAAVVAFVATGLWAHAIHPLEYPLHAAGTAAPFLVGWLVVAPLGGAYARRPGRAVTRELGHVAALWVGAALLGAALRASPLFHGGAPPSFVAVNVAVGLPFLLGWRAAAAGLGRVLQTP